MSPAPPQSAGHRSSSSRGHLERFVAAAAASVPAGALVLDAGAGDAPYADFFAHARYETADFMGSDRLYAPPTYVCDLADIPVDDARFDLVLCSQVLEHVPEPRAVIAELARVLKPGGSLWLSTPLFYEEHEQPHDFFRYTQFALRRLMEEVGLQVERIDWLEGYLGTLGYQLRFASGAMPTTPAAWGNSRLWAIAARAARPILHRLGSRLDSFDAQHPFMDRGMPKNYVVVAHRPQAKEPH